MDDVIRSMPLELRVSGLTIQQQLFLDARHDGELDIALFSLAVSHIRQSLPDGSIKIFVASVERAKQMHAVPFRDVQVLTPPSEPRVKSPPWIQQVDVFQLQVLVLPFAFVNSTSKAREYHVVYIDMEKRIIHVLSPRHGIRMYNIMVQVSHNLIFCR